MARRVHSVCCTMGRFAANITLVARVQREINLPPVHGFCAGDKRLAALIKLCFYFVCVVAAIHGYVGTLLTKNRS